jgi:hypothetical protein
MAVIATVAALLVIVDPYGMGPFGRSPHPRLMDSNQRAMIPQILRSRQFDSVVAGSSVVALMAPAVLEQSLGGRFANVGMIGAHPAEIEHAVRLFARETPGARTLVLGLDPNWCSPVSLGAGRRRFPTAFYDANPWNDVAEYWTLESLEIAMRKLAALAGLARPRLREDGYEVFSMDETRYDPARARALIAADSAAVDRGAGRQDAGRQDAGRQDAGNTPSAFPELVRLERILASLPAGALALIAFMPQHQSVQPRAGTPRDARLAACKQHIAAIAARAGAGFVDFYLPSPLTQRDDNFWDGAHARISVAGRIIDVLSQVRLKTAGDADDGSWRILTRPSL